MSEITIRIEFLTLAQRTRRDDWAIARASFTTSGWGTSGGHTIHNYADRGRLSVEPARGTILNPETKQAILEEYHKVVMHDRYFEERELYGIWYVATCAEPVKYYLIHWAKDDANEYERVTAPTLREALALARRHQAPDWAQGIMAADYDEARQAGIQFFEGDGLLT